MGYALTVVFGIAAVVAAGALGQLVGRVLRWRTTSWHRPAARRGTHPEAGGVAALMLGIICLVTPVVALVVFGARRAIPTDGGELAFAVGLVAMVLGFGWFQLRHYWTEQLAELDYVDAVRAMVGRMDRLVNRRPVPQPEHADDQAEAVRRFRELATATAERPGREDLDVDALADRVQDAMRPLPGGPASVDQLQEARDRVRRARDAMERVIARRDGGKTN